MKIAFVSQFSAFDIHSWSGIPYNMSRCLEDSSHTLLHISPLKEKWPLIYKGKKAYYRLRTGRDYHRDREPAVLDHYARQVSQELRGSDADIVFSPGTIPIAHLSCEQPIVFWTDATFAGMAEYYPGFSNLTPETRAAGDAMESSALNRSKLAIYSSDWAAETAINYYGTDPKKVKVVPFGANRTGLMSREAIAEVVALTFRAMQAPLHWRCMASQGRRHRDRRSPTTE